MRTGVVQHLQPRRAEPAASAWWILAAAVGCGSGHGYPVLGIDRHQHSQRSCSHDCRRYGHLGCPGLAQHADRHGSAELPERLDERDVHGCGCDRCRGWCAVDWWREPFGRGCCRGWWSHVRRLAGDGLQGPVARQQRDRLRAWWCDGGRRLPRQLRQLVPACVPYDDSITTIGMPCFKGRRKQAGASPPVFFLQTLEIDYIRENCVTTF